MMKLTGDTEQFEAFLDRNDEMGVIVGAYAFIHKDELFEIFKKNEITEVYEINENTYLGLGMNNLKIKSM